MEEEDDQNKLILKQVVF